MSVARILCVDDDPEAVLLKCSILERAGHSVITSQSAGDAIRKLQQSTFDAVVTDWRIGAQDAHSILETAKNYDSGPVVVVSGFVEEAFQASEPLADLYLEKPVNPQELVQIIAALLHTAKMEDGSEGKSENDPMTTG
jgi:DNA-binding response OmpR family regulator